MHRHSLPFNIHDYTNSALCSQNMIFSNVIRLIENNPSVMSHLKINCFMDGRLSRDNIGICDMKSRHIGTRIQPSPGTVPFSKNSMGRKFRSVPLSRDSNSVVPRDKRDHDENPRDCPVQGCKSQAWQIGPGRAANLSGLGRACRVRMPAEPGRSGPKFLRAGPFLPIFREDFANIPPFFWKNNA